MNWMHQLRSSLAVSSSMSSEELTLRRKVFVLKIQLKFYPIVRSRCKYHWSGERKKSSRFINIYRSLNKSIKTAAYSDQPLGRAIKTRLHNVIHFTIPVALVARHKANARTTIWQSSSSITKHRYIKQKIV